MDAEKKTKSPKFTGDFLSLYIAALESGATKQDFMKTNGINGVVFAQKYRSAVLQILEKSNKLQEILPALPEAQEISNDDNFSSLLDRLKKIKTPKKPNT